MQFIAGLFYFILFYICGERTCRRIFFTALHLCDKTKQICADILISHERSFILLFWQDGWWGMTPSIPEIFGQTDPVGAKTLIFNRYSVAALQP